jgi:hypothetical protein
MGDEMDDDRRELIRRQVWTSMHEVLRQLDLEHPGVSDAELMRLLRRELTERLGRPKAEPEAEG